jgi:hypothetical protein
MVFMREKEGSEAFVGICPINRKRAFCWVGSAEGGRQQQIAILRSSRVAGTWPFAVNILALFYWKLSLSWRPITGRSQKQNPTPCPSFLQILALTAIEHSRDLTALERNPLAQSRPKVHELSQLSVRPGP